MNKSFPQELADSQPKVWQIIQSYLPKAPNKFSRMISDYPMRQGQYLRPALLLFANNIMGGADSTALLTAATLQVGHEWLIIHDDVEDQAEIRRGRVSLNKLHNDALAINVGDTIHLIMWRMVLDNTKMLGLKLGEKISYLIQNTLYQTTLGQFYELNWIQNQKFNITAGEYFQMIDKKTGQYTITSPVQIAAILAGQENLLPVIEKFSQPWGRAYQILNDVQNIKKLTPNMPNDISEGKHTLFFIHILSQSTQKESAEIKKIYSKQPVEKTLAEIEFILHLIKKYQSINYVTKIAEKMTNQARLKINKTQMKPLLEPLEYSTAPET